MTNKRIVIVGFMGCGKTTVARAVAGRLACEFVDLDSLVTEREGRSPAEIIQADGEAVFRQIETRALNAVLDDQTARIIALGGGAWTIEVNRALVARRGCMSVWLDAPFELCWKRITDNAHTVRPLAPTRHAAQQLHESRRISYLLAQIRIDATKSLDELAAEIAGAATDSNSTQ
jgi:shikimate kinase